MYVCKDKWVRFNNHSVNAEYEQWSLADIGLCSAGTVSQVPMPDTPFSKILYLFASVLVPPACLRR